jgi:hypothetical protein
MANEIVSQLILDLDKFREQLKEAEKAGAGAGLKVGKDIGEGAEAGLAAAGGGLVKTAVKIGAAVAAAFAFHKIIEAANEGDAAVQKFNAALAASNQFSTAASERFQAVVESIQATTTASNDAIVKNGALLVSMGGLTGATLERATKAAVELSAGLQVDLGTAFQMVGRAAEGNMRAFREMGIRVAETGSTAKNFEAILGTIESRFRGMAEAQTKTFDGAMAQTKNNFSDLLKALGQIVTHSPLVVGVVQIISKWIGKLGDAVKEFGGGSDPVKAITLSFIRFGESIAKYVIPPFEFLYNLGKVLFNALATGLSVLVTGTAMAIQGMLEVASLFTDKFNGARDALRQLSSDFQDTTAGLATGTAESFQSAFDFSFTAGAESMLAKADTFVAAFGEKMKALPDQLGPPTERMSKEMIALLNSLQATVGQGMTTLMSGTVQRLGATLVKGGSAFSDFKNFALNAIGDMSIKMGEAMVVQSAAFQAMAALITNPFTAAGASLAFGLALIAIGGILKAAAGGSGAASAASLGGGGVAAGDGGLAPAGGTASQAAIEKQEPGTKVVVNVQGNVLDRKETGLELAAIINEAFGSQGVTYATGGA